MSSFADLLKNVETAHKKERFHPVVRDLPQSIWSSTQEEFLSTQAPKLVLTALAGTGKTSCLIEYARRRRHQNWNFIVFNRSVADEVARRAPPNMHVRTAHQMAYAHFGHDLNHKIKTHQQITEIEAQLNFVAPCARRDFAVLTQNVFHEYLNSAALQITENLIPQLEWERFQAKYPDISWSHSDIVRSVENLWRLSLDPNAQLSITHDVYLKRFSMVHNPWKKTCWMLDESQDWSDAFLACFKRSASISIRTGDPYQKLYEWRGASRQKWCNPHAEKEIWLTDSYRTGSGVEKWVNSRLKSLSCSHSWSSALTSVCDVSHTEENVNTIKCFAPNVILATRWDDLKQISTKLHKDGITHYLKNEGSSPTGICLTTIHSAKGLEFDRVWILDNALHSDDHAVQKSRLAYVALTRAKKAIRIPSNWPKISAPVSLFDM